MHQIDTRLCTSASQPHSSAHFPAIISKHSRSRRAQKILFRCSMSLLQKCAPFPYILPCFFPISMFHSVFVQKSVILELVLLPSQGKISTKLQKRGISANVKFDSSFRNIRLESCTSWPLGDNILRSKRHGQLTHLLLSGELTISFTKCDIGALFRKRSRTHVYLQTKRFQIT